MNKRNIADLIRKIVGEASLDSFVAVVDKVSGRTCDITPLGVDCDNSLYTDVRLNVDTNADFGLLITPVVGSIVVVTKLSENDLQMSFCSEIEKIELKMGNLQMKIEDNKVQLKNESFGLAQTFSELITELKAAIITTPSGAGTVSPTTVGKLDLLQSKIDKYLE